MNKEKLEEMILEELMLEADADDAYKQKAIEIFGDMAKDEAGLTAIKTIFPTVEKLQGADENAQQQIAGLAGDTNKIETDDIQRLATLQTNTPEKLSLKQLLDLAASDRSSDAGSAATSTDERTDATKSTSEPSSEPTTKPTSTSTETPPSEEDEVDTDLFVPTEDVKKAVEAMKGFYDKPYLYEQGDLLRVLIKTIEAALTGEDRTAGFTKTTTVATESLQEAKGLNIKNIKASLNAFLQQTRKVKKALKEYIAMAGEAKAGAKRKKGILDKEVDQLIEYGKMILKSLPKTKTITEADNAGTDPETAEESVKLQPLHDFIDFIIGGSLKSSNKEVVQEELDKIKPILKVFPNVAPFGSAGGPELKDYENKFQEAIDTHLKTAIANFKSLESAKGGEVAIDRLRNALIQFLGDGLTILGKNVKGDDIENLGSDEAISPEDETAPASDLSPETIMKELGLDSDKKITTTSDEETAFKIMNSIFYRLKDEMFNDPDKIENFIYDYVKKDEDNWLKKLAKGTLRFTPIRESNENQNFKDEFSENFIKKIKEMHVNWKNNENKNQLRTSAKELAKYSNEMLTKYQKLSDDKGKTNTGAQLSDMFRNLYWHIHSKYSPDGENIHDGFKSSETNKKVHKALKLINDNIDKVDYKIFLKTLTKIDPKNLDNVNIQRIKNISKKIFKSKNHFWSLFKINGVDVYEDDDNLKSFVFIGAKDNNNNPALYSFDYDQNIDQITTSISKWWNTIDVNNITKEQKELLVNTLDEIKDKIKGQELEVSEDSEEYSNQVRQITPGKIEIIKFQKTGWEPDKLFVIWKEIGTTDKNEYYNSYLVTDFMKRVKMNDAIKEEQIQRKLEKLVENYINKRKQQWQKRIM